MAEFAAALCASDGECVRRKVAFMPPHEVLHTLVLVQLGDLQVVKDFSALDGMSLEKYEFVKDTLGCQGLVPLATWADSVPRAWDRSEASKAYTWGLCGQVSKKYGRLRFPVIVLPHHQCCREIHMHIMATMKWSF